MVDETALDNDAHADTECIDDYYCGVKNAADSVGDKKWGWGEGGSSNVSDGNTSSVYVEIGRPAADVD